MIPHKPRKYLKSKPHHLTIKTSVPGVNFNHPILRKSIIYLLNLVSKKPGVALSAYSILSNHIHIILQFDHDTDKGKLTRDALFGNTMRMFVSQISRAVNKLYKRKGQVFSDRYWMRPLKTVRYIVNGFRYVLFNTLKHLHINSDLKLSDDPRSCLYGFIKKMVSMKIIKSTRYVLLRGESDYKHRSYHQLVSDLVYL